MSIRRLIGVLADDYPNLRQIEVTGVVNADAKRFQVNFRNVSEEYLMHFNVRFDENCVVRNSTRDGGQWQKEERDGGMPFHQGQPFDVLFEIDPTAVEIRVGDQPFVSFQLRDDLKQLTAIEVFGDAHDVELKMRPPKPQSPEQVMTVPAPGPLLPLPNGGSGPNVSTGETPYRGSLAGFMHSHRVRVVGTPLPGARRFTVNFRAPNGDVLFHYNPRLDENCVVRNSSKAGQFGREEREGECCPFEPGSSFALDFHLHGGVIRCFVNGIENCQFAPRDDLSHADTIEVLGDVRLSQVVVLGGGEEAHPVRRSVSSETPAAGKIPLPHQCALAGFTTKSRRLRIVGMPLPEAATFTVNFTAASGDALFHYNPRFDQNCVIRNSSRAGAFQQEERDGEGCPFAPGRRFALDFLHHDDVIRCFVDGLEDCQFTPRDDFSHAETLEIRGDIELEQVLIA